MRVGDELWAAVWHAGFRVLDGSDLSDMRELGRYRWPKTIPEPTHTVMPLAREIGGRRYAVAIDEEHDHKPGRLHGFLWVLDVTELRAIEPVAAWDLSVRASPWVGEEGVRFGDFCALAWVDEWDVERTARAFAASATWADTSEVASTDVFERLRLGAGISLPVRDGLPLPDGAPHEPLGSPYHTLRVERPFTLHGALAPSAAYARFADGHLEVVSHSQGIYPLRWSIAKSLCLPADSVTIEHRPGSGCYGHNGADDAAYEAALVAYHRPGTPVLLKWTREDEHGYAPAGTAQAVELSAELGEGGFPVALAVETIGGTFRGRPRGGPKGDGETRLVANHLRETPVAPSVPLPNLNRNGGLHRNLDPIYDIPDIRLTKTLVTEMPLRTSALRCLGAVANITALESLIDEAAELAGADPFAFRLAHLDDPRGAAVLARLAETVPPVAEGSSRGIAFARYKNEMAWVAVDVVVSDDATVDVPAIRLVCDAGRVLDREGAVAQLEGGAIQAVSWALFEEAAWGSEGITSRDWESYPALRFDDVPEIEVESIPQPEETPLGVGEAAPGPVVAALVNAVPRVVGLRLRRLPMTRDRIVAAALEA
jgi:CO/xanthine dehydrogenase Mo-binding subunit